LKKTRLRDVSSMCLLIISLITKHDCVPDHNFSKTTPTKAPAIFSVISVFLCFFFLVGCCFRVLIIRFFYCNDPDFPIKAP